MEIESKHRELSIGLVCTTFRILQPNFEILSRATCDLEIASTLLLVKIIALLSNDIQVKRILNILLIYSNY